MHVGKKNTTSIMSHLSKGKTKLTEINVSGGGRDAAIQCQLLNEKVERKVSLSS